MIMDSFSEDVVTDSKQDKILGILRNQDSDRLIFDFEEFF